MKIKTYSRGDAQKAMNEWIRSYPDLPALDDSMMYLRTEIQALNRQARTDTESTGETKRSDYVMDVLFGLRLYEYLDMQPWFSLRAAADDGFWRFLSLAVVPDVVAQRWGKDNADHYYSKGARIWLRSLWWYVYLAWQGSADLTKKVLLTPHFSTDTILNFEERTGRHGTCVEAYRKIIYYYSLIPTRALKDYSARMGCGESFFFRAVMKLNTAKMATMEPALCLGGEDGYAKELFINVGVAPDVAESN